MPGDALNYKYLADELQILLGGRVDKIFVLDETVVFVVHTTVGNKSLLISASPSSPRIHLTKQTFTNAPVPSSFLLHLRKKLGGAIVKSISLVPFERIIKIEFDCHNEIGMKFNRVLYAEIMGKYSNIILTEEGKITECIKHVTPDISSVRSVLPGLSYSLPPKQNKFTAFDTQAIVDALVGFDDGNVVNKILSVMYGLAPATIKAVFRNEEFNLPLDFSTALNIANTLKNLYYISPNPCIVTIDGKPDYFFAPLGFEQVEFACTLSEAMETVYEQKQQNAAKTEKSARLGLLIKNAVARTEKKLAGFLQKQRECEDLETDKLYGELITANIYKLKTGLKKFLADNYYDGSVVEIPLDEQLSPQQNAQIYYKRYNKKKKTLDNLETQISASCDDLEKLNSAMQSLEFSSEREYPDIEAELDAIGIIKKRGRTVKTQPSAPIKTVCDGFTVYIGKNNVQNDRLVRTCDKRDIWLHTKDIHGSHVVIKTEGKEVPPAVIETAASHAAYYSKGRLSGKVAVDYTLLKFVNKPSGAPPGKVIYTNQKTIFVTPIKVED